MLIGAGIFALVGQMTELAAESLLGRTFGIHGSAAWVPVLAVAAIVAVLIVAAQWITVRRRGSDRDEQAHSQH